MNTDELLEELGYDPEKWRKQQQEQYEEMAEDVKFYSMDFDEESAPLIKSFIPWDGQRP